MKLLCISPYSNIPAKLVFVPGQQVDVTDEVGKFLLVDSPSSFQIVGAKPIAIEIVEEDKEVEAPPKDKMVRRAQSRKTK